MGAMVCILERANIINSAGSCLRDLTKGTACGEFFLGPMIMAALEATAGETLRAG
jgi:replication initiation protein RepC